MQTSSSARFLVLLVFHALTVSFAAICGNGNSVGWSVKSDDPTCMSRCYDDMNGWTISTNSCRYLNPGIDPGVGPSYVSTEWTSNSVGGLSPWATGTTTTITSDKCGHYEILGTGTNYPEVLYVICTACATGYKSTGAHSVSVSWVNSGASKLAVVDCVVAPDTLSPTPAPLCVDTDQSSNGDTDGEKCDKYTVSNAATWCGSYDDSDFFSRSMCCACGGGSTGSNQDVPTVSLPKISLSDTSDGSATSTCTVVDNCIYNGKFVPSSSNTEYNNNEKCVFTTDQRAILRVSNWEVEKVKSSSGNPWDYMTVNGVKYAGEAISGAPNYEVIEAGGTVSWSSDSSIQKDGFEICFIPFTSSPTTSPTKSPTVSPTKSPTLAPTTPNPTVTPGSPTQAPTTSSPSQAPTTSAPTKAPTKGPTSSPTTSSPTASPTITRTLSPTSTLGCINRCWTGNEDCCSKITTNLFVSSLITERILYFDLENNMYNVFLEKGAMQSDADKISMEHTLGSSHLAFSTTGSEIYYSRPKTQEGPGGIESFDAQTGDFKTTVIDHSAFSTATAYSTHFNPGVLKVIRSSSGEDVRLFSDRESKTLWMVAGDTFTRLLDENCDILDIAADLSATNAIEILTLTKCANGEYRVYICVDSASSDHTAATLPAGFSATSIEWVGGGDTPTDKFWVAGQPADIENEAHILQFDMQSLSSHTDILFKSHLENTRGGIDIGMIRRAPNEMVYCSERTYGLPLILDPSISGNSVIGQTGAMFGGLADSYALTFSPNAYGLKSVVTYKNGQNTIVAGEEQEFDVVLKDSIGEDVEATTHLHAEFEVSSGGLLTGQSLNNEITQSLQNRSHYHGKLRINRASETAKDAADMFHFKILTGLGMQIGETKSFWVVAGAASPVTSALQSTYESSTAGRPVDLHVDTYDQFSNHRAFDDVDGDLEDMKKLEVRLLDAGGDYVDVNPNNVTIQRVSSGTFRIRIISIISRPFTYEVMYDGERISNSPAHIIFDPAEFSATKSEAAGEALKKFVPMDVDARPNTFRIWAKDKYGNIIPGRDVEKHLNVSIWAFQEEEHYDELTLQAKELGSSTKEIIRKEQIPVKTYFEADGSMTFTFLVDNTYIDFIELTANYTRTGEAILYGNEPLDKFRISPSVVITVKAVANEEMRVIMGLAGFVVAYTLVIMFFVWWWRSENAIKFSQRKLLNLLLLGCIVVNVTIMLTTVPAVIEWKYSCSLYIWGAVIGLTLIEYTLIAKLYRVHSIAYAQGTQRIKITDQFLLKRIAMAIAVTALYTLVASFVSPLRKAPLRMVEPELDKYGTEHYIEINECPWMEHRIWLPLAFVVVGALICVCAMATQSRKIPSAFAESKWIALSMYTLILCLCFVGLLFNDPNLKFERPAFYHAGVATPITLSSFVFMTLMFAPKFRKIIKGKKIELHDIKPQSDDDSASSGMELQRVKSGVRRASARHDSRFSFRSSIGTLGVGSPMSSNPLSEEGRASGSSAMELEEKHKKEVDALKKKLQAAEGQMKRMEMKYREEKKKNEARRTEEARSNALGGTTLEKIPEGSNWKIFYDQDGNPYYYNITTEECSYTRPQKWF